MSRKPKLSASKKQNSAAHRASTLRSKTKQQAQKHKLPFEDNVSDDDDDLDDLQIEQDYVEFDVRCFYHRFL